MDAFRLLVLAPCTCWLAAAVSAAGPSAHLLPEQRAVAFLAVEVPQWSKTNHCFSCHNNGDAARALYAARELGFEVPTGALADTTDWLTHPEAWEDNGGDENFRDKALARVQFAAALCAAVETGAVKDRKPLLTAAESLLPLQGDDGSWATSAQRTLGSPATYGPALATYQARRTLRAADPQRFARAITDADRWFRRNPPKTVLDAAAMLLALGNSDDPAACAQRQRCLEVIRRGQAKNGGWGPYINSSPEPFDTAVVLLALREVQDAHTFTQMLRRGHGYLAASQLPDGSWLETTRPAGAESYAQRISTAGWATLALLATRE